MLHLIIWYLIISLLGLLAFPLVFKLLPALSDRGYALSRILGLLLWGYIFWILGSFGFIRNDVGGEFFAVLLLGIFGGISLKKASWREMKLWFKSNTRMMVAVEALFLCAFIVLAFIRSFNPDILGTEKPMELAFINAILRSPSLPPNDPWLSGYSISYYYFGYLLVSMIARLAGTSAGVAFNLGISLVFALTAIGSYSVLYNLIDHKKNPQGKPNPQILALLGPFFILIVSNLGGFLHILRVNGVFWQIDQTGLKASKIWSWLDIGRYAQPPPGELFPHWWWWQASRIVQDFDFNWVNKGDIIDEFPFFSYLLGDLHPHVLAMPIVFLTISLALNLIAGGGKGKFKWLWMKIHMNPQSFIISSLVLGSLAFFNTWDFPFYVSLFAGAYILRDMFLEKVEIGLPIKPSIFQILGVIVRIGFALGVSGIVLYFPFYFGFQSQAGGPLPNLIYVTRGVYTWIHFMPLLIPIFYFLFFAWRNDLSKQSLKKGFILTMALVVILLLMSLLLAFLISNLQLFQKINPEAAIASDAFLSSMAAPSWWLLVLEGLKRRLIVPGTLVTIIFILSYCFTLLWPRQNIDSKDSRDYNLSYQSPSNLFVYLLILIGALLVFAPEFIFLRDLFGYRINTIFKFYFQVWLLWGIAAGYSLIILWGKFTGFVKIVFRSTIAIVLTLSLAYPVMGVWTRTNGFQVGDGLTLDGAAFIFKSNPDEAVAMQWLKGAPIGIVSEAIGGSYTQFARMASNTGQPTVLGWDFHEVQWRGGTDEIGSRKTDIERMYCTGNWEEAKTIINQYKVRYVVVGSLEENTYSIGSSICPSGLNTIKFSRNLIVGFQQGSTTIYIVPDF